MTPGNGQGQRDTKEVLRVGRGPLGACAPLRAAFDSHMSSLMASASPAARDLLSQDALGPTWPVLRKEKAGKEAPSLPSKADFVSFTCW